MLAQKLASASVMMALSIHQIIGKKQGLGIGNARSALRGHSPSAKHQRASLEARQDAYPTLASHPSLVPKSRLLARQVIRRSVRTHRDSSPNSSPARPNRLGRSQRQKLLPRTIILSWHHVLSRMVPKEVSPPVRQQYGGKHRCVSPAMTKLK